MDAWPHQIRAETELDLAIESGERRICVTSPTGGGKTYIMIGLIREYLAKGLRVVLYSNRKMLIEQISGVLDKHHIPHGVRAAGHPDRRQFAMQISSLQTESSRVLKGGENSEWSTLHGASLVLIDEAHNNAGNTARTILDRHFDAGAVLVGFTATPIEIGHVYTFLIQAGITSELRKCGALVHSVHYGPDEPDLKVIGKVQIGHDLTEGQNRKAMMREGIFGRVFNEWKRLNPDGKPTILFAPGVGESVWFAEQFHKQGVSAAHIDGQDVWINGETFRTSQEVREEVLQSSKNGQVGVICNRFVLREGVDLPWLQHGIFATVFGSLQSYIQSGGRLLRAYKDGTKDFAVIQDHGGNWHRNGSLNEDRFWDLDMSASMITGLREEGLRNKSIDEPFRCPSCSMILRRRDCQCGFKASIRTRMVVQSDGTLKEMKGDIYQPRVTQLRSDTAKLWTQMYYRAKNSKTKMTFRQAEALFLHENKYWPPRDLKLMPISQTDWFLPVAVVSPEKLK